MSPGPESPASQTCLVTSNVVALGDAGIEKAETGRFAIRARLAGFVSGGLQDGSEQWFQSFLTQLRPGESLSIGVAFDAEGGLSFGAAACAAQPSIEARMRELEQALREVVASAAPHFKLAPDRDMRACALPWKVELRPAGRRICLDDLAGGLPRPVATSIARPPEQLAIRLGLCPERRPDLAAVASLMGRPALRGAVLELDLSSFRLDAHHRRALQKFLNGLMQASRGAYDVPLLMDDRALRQLKSWSTAGHGLRLSARLFARESVPGALSRHAVPGALRPDQVH